MTVNQLIEMLRQIPDGSTKILSCRRSEVIAYQIDGLKKVPYVSEGILEYAYVLLTE